MAIRIRAARPSDVAALVSIEQAAFSGDRLSARSLRRLVERGTADVLLAFSGEHPIGYCMVLHRRNSDAARLYSIAVTAGAPRGAGRELLAAAEEAAHTRGAASIRLEVRQDNLRAIALYERSGYRRIGQRSGYYEDGATALRYEKRIGHGGETPRAVVSDVMAGQ